jgi:hypothetical protein
MAAMLGWKCGAGKLQWATFPGTLQECVGVSYWVAVADREWFARVGNDNEIDIIGMGFMATTVKWLWCHRLVVDRVDQIQEIS